MTIEPVIIIILIILGIWLWWARKHKQRERWLTNELIKRGKKTDGKITDRQMDDSGEEPVYKIAYYFRAEDGEGYGSVMYVPQWAYEKYTEGTIVLIFYLPEDPLHSMLAEELVISKLHAEGKL